MVDRLDAYMTVNSSQPIIIPIANRLYELLEPFETHLVCEPDIEISIQIPEGFINDGASVPRWAWWFLRPDGIHRAACIIHDYLLERGGHLRGDAFAILDKETMQWVQSDRFISKSEADRIFRVMLEDYGVVKWRAKVAHVIASLFGKGKYLD
jgi:hypothetical protein